MRLLILFISFLILTRANGQGFSVDRSDGYLGTAFIYCADQNIDSAIIILDKSIKHDSLCNDLYLIRGFVKLLLVDEYEESAIIDLDKYISNRTSGQDKICTLNDTLTQIWCKGIIDYKPSGQLGGAINQLVGPAQDILYGVIALFYADRGNPCEYWNHVRQNGDKKVTLLIDKYCK